MAVSCGYAPAAQWQAAKFETVALSIRQSTCGCCVSEGRDASRAVDEGGVEAERMGARAARRRRQAGTGYEAKVGGRGWARSAKSAVSFLRGQAHVVAQKDKGVAQWKRKSRKSHYGVLNREMRAVSADASRAEQGRRCCCCAALDVCSTSSQASMPVAAGPSPEERNHTLSHHSSLIKDSDWTRCDRTQHPIPMI